jgi:hypothetical protein
MALNRVSAPSSTFSAASDWSAVVAQLAALVLDKEEPIRISGSNILKGSVFNIGGTLYVADADTAISGTASDYVAITAAGATASAAFVSSLSGVAWNSTYKGYYVTASGALMVFDEAKAFFAGVISALYTNNGLSRTRHGCASFFSSGTFKVPTGVYKLKITGCAAGGNGANAYGTQAGGGGGGGASALKKSLSVTSESTLTITIGAVGSATTITGSPDGTFTLNCGANASGTSAGAGGTIGSGTKAGGYGGNGGASAGISGGPGASGLQTGGAGAASASNGVTVYGGGGGGGGSYSSGGHGISVNCVSSAIMPGYGGGGGGGCGGGSYTLGASGGPAIIIIEW